jgi:hypothetical protein
MEILLTNVGRDPIEIDVEDWNLKKYQDAHRAAELNLKCSRRIPITKFALIQAKEGNQYLFRGYIQKPKIKNLQERELNCKGEEDFLLRRVTGRYSLVPEANRLVHAFQSDAPSQVADAYGVTGNVGLLFMANSMIPYHGNVITTGTPNYDWFAHGHDWIYYLAGLGAASRIGTDKAIYAEGKLLPRADTFLELEDASHKISCWSDADDLWIRLDDAAYNVGFGPRSLLMAENAYDTGVRLGIIDHPDTVLKGNLQLNFDRIMDILIDIAESYGLDPRFRYEANHTYLDLMIDPVDDEFVLPEANIREISQSIGSDPKPYALIGRGIGSRDVQHIYTPSDHSWMGPWWVETYDVSEGFLDANGNLKPMVDAEYARRIDDEIFTVKPTSEWGNCPKPNDTVLLELLGESDRSLLVASVKTNMKSDIEMELGGRKSEILDAFQAKSSLSRVYYQEYLVQFGKAVTISPSNTGNLQLGDTTHGWCPVGGAASFTLPSDLYQEDGSHRVTLDYSVRSDEKPTPCMIWFQIGGGENYLCQPRHYLLGDSIQNLDITAMCNFGTATTIDFWIKKTGEWPGATCTEHPTAYFTVTINAWKRAR